ncbi:hypothetical protein [Promicromonospora iranensis]|uniref:hypothetical protein n=1 Tax=Promicromonospora iranensis TaxID=1105144 RepID=UPI0023A9EA91|nr:hypothetical protein [Promicromonospora iranensis]
MIRATASDTTPQPTVRAAPARRPALLVLLVLLLTMLALGSSAAVGQRATAAKFSNDNIWVNADGVAFERGSESDEVAYVVRPPGERRGGRAFSRELTRDEQRQGWTSFWEAWQAYPDGYCVVWVEVEDASNWHESGNNTACRGNPQQAPTSTPTPTPTPPKADEPAEGQAPAAPKPARPPAPVAEDSPAPSSAPTPVASPTPPTPTPAPTPSASPSPSPSVSGTPSPSPSHTSPQAALLQNLRDQQQPQTQAVAVQQDEIISPLGWVAVLGAGALLAAGGVLLLWRRLT